MSGGKTPSQTTTTTKNEPPAWAVPYYQRLLGTSSNLANRPYEAYPGEQIAGLQPEQLVAQQMVTDRALGPQAADSGINFAQGLLAGQGQFNAGINPYLGQSMQVGDNQFIGQSSPVGSNQYMGQTTGVGQNSIIGQRLNVGDNSMIGATTDVGSNQFAGSNPYLGQMIDQSSRDVTDAFNRSEVPGMMAQFNAGGAFGGTAHMDAMNQSQDALASRLGDLSNQYRFQDYQTQQQLAEADINRRVQAQQTDLARNAGLIESGLDRDLGAQQTDLARDAGLIESGIDRSTNTALADLARNAGLSEADVARRLEAWQADIGRDSALTEAGLDRDLGAQQADLARNAQLAESGLDRAQDAWSANQGSQMQALALLPMLDQAGYYGAQQLAGVGDSRQQLTQSALDSQYANWIEARDWQANQLGLLGNALNSVQGGFQNGQVTAPNLNRPNPGAGALGGAASGAAMGSSFGPWGTAIGAIGGGLLGYFGNR